MQPGLPQGTPAGLTGSALVGLLCRLALIDSPGGAERSGTASARPHGGSSLVVGLGQWLSWADAIPLSAALNGPVSAPAVGVGATGGLAVERALTQLQTDLVQRIEAEPASARAHDVSASRSRYQVLQQAMQTRIGALRTQARAAVARSSPGLARLAEIDQVMQGVLAPREQALLALMPTLLERHFERLRAAQADRGAAPEGTAWLATFHQDMRQLLRAELDLRLQPVQGLVEALRDHAGAATDAQAHALAHTRGHS